MPCQTRGAIPSAESSSIIKFAGQPPGFKSWSPSESTVGLTSNHGSLIMLYRWRYSILDFNSNVQPKRKTHSKSEKKSGYFRFLSFLSPSKPKCSMNVPFISPFQRHLVMDPCGHGQVGHEGAETIQGHGLRESILLKSIYLQFGMGEYIYIYMQKNTYTYVCIRIFMCMYL